MLWFSLFLGVAVCQSLVRLPWAFVTAELGGQISVDYPTPITAWLQFPAATDTMFGLRSAIAELVIEPDFIVIPAGAVSVQTTATLTVNVPGPVSFTVVMTGSDAVLATAEVDMEVVEGAPMDPSPTFCPISPTSTPAPSSLMSGMFVCMGCYNSTHDGGVFMQNLTNYVRSGLLNTLWPVAYAIDSNGAMLKTDYAGLNFEMYMATLINRGYKVIPTFYCDKSQSDGGPAYNCSAQGFARILASGNEQAFFQSTIDAASIGVVKYSGYLVDIEWVYESTFQSFASIPGLLKRWSAALKAALGPSFLFQVAFTTYGKWYTELQTPDSTIDTFLLMSYANSYQNFSDNVVTFVNVHQYVSANQMPVRGAYGTITNPNFRGDMPHDDFCKMMTCAREEVPYVMNWNSYNRDNHGGPTNLLNPDWIDGLRTYLTGVGCPPS